MKTIGVTIGIDVGPFNENTEEWYKTAYSRLAKWSCGFVERNLGLETRIIGEEYVHLGVGRFPPTTLKLDVFNIFPDVDRVVFFDADWRPVRKFNVFDYCPDPEQLYFTLDRQPLSGVLALEDRYGLPRNRYFNTGFFVASRKHHELFQRAKRNYNNYHEEFWDQCVMNQDFNPEVTIADKRLNVKDIKENFKHNIQTHPDTPIWKKRNILGYHHMMNHWIMEGWIPDFDWDADE